MHPFCSTFQLVHSIKVQNMSAEEASFLAFLGGDGTVPLSEVCDHAYFRAVAAQEAVGLDVRLQTRVLLQKEAVCASGFEAALRLSRLRPEHIQVNDTGTGHISVSLNKALIIPWLIVCGPMELEYSPIGEAIENLCAKVSHVQLPIFVSSNTC